MTNLREFLWPFHTQWTAVLVGTASDGCHQTLY